MAYRDSDQKFHNLVGVVPCGNGTRPPVLIGAHYDSVIDAPCADDNAAAVAIALAAATPLAGQKLDRDVVIALFDAEEPPYFHTECMGSTRFYRDQMLPEGVHAAIIMDLVGHDVSVPIPGASKVLPGLSDIVCFTGAESHPEMAGIVAAQDFGQARPDRDAEQQRRRHERPPHLPQERRPLPVSVVRTVEALPPGERYAGEAELREDGAYHPVARRADDRPCCGFQQDQLNE